MKRLSLLLALLTIVTTPLVAGYRVIAHPGAAVSTISKKDAAAIFLKKTVKWEDGTVITVIDQVEAAPVRTSFTTAIHGKSVAAIRSYWQQQIFSGRGVPPLEEKTDAAVLERVRSKVGAIGYISDTTQPTGVKTLEIQ